MYFGGDSRRSATRGDAANRRPRLALVVALLGCLVAAPQRGGAVVRSCGADALANTANVLCASPSGPCTGTSVTVGATLEVTSGGCAFDLGGRALVVDHTFDMIGSGFITIANAGDVTITDAGRLRARGDYAVTPIAEGGTITIQSSGTLDHDGTIDVSGDPSGMIDLRFAGSVTLQPGSQLRGVGTSAADESDGGTLNIVSTGGSITVNGDVLMNGEIYGGGGDVTMQAAGNLDVLKPIEASGGEDGGGSIDLASGDDLTITAYLDATSGNAGGGGGEIDLEAGVDSLGGAMSGGALTIDEATMKLEGSSGSGFGGAGGDFRASANGPMLVTSTATIRVNAGSGFDGSGGTIFMTTADDDMSTVSALDDDLTLQGMVKGKSGDGGGTGGDLTLLAGRDLNVSADVDLGGTAAGGSVQAESGGTLALTSQINAGASTMTGSGGAFTAKACTVSLNASSALLANGEWGGQIELTSREHMTINAGSDVDASGFFGSIRLVTRSFGTCSNNPSRHCVSTADCIVGCSVGSCQNVNPDTGGTTTQFSPPPDLIEDPSLTACQ